MTITPGLQLKEAGWKDDTKWLLDHSALSPYVGTAVKDLRLGGENISDSLTNRWKVLQHLRTMSPDKLREHNPQLQTSWDKMNQFLSNPITRDAFMEDLAENSKKLGIDKYMSDPSWTPKLKMRSFWDTVAEASGKESLNRQGLWRYFTGDGGDTGFWKSLGNSVVGLGSDTVGGIMGALHNTGQATSDYEPYIAMDAAGNFSIKSPKMDAKAALGDGLRGMAVVPTGGAAVGVGKLGLKAMGKNVATNTTKKKLLGSTGGQLLAGGAMGGADAFIGGYDHLLNQEAFRSSGDYAAEAGDITNRILSLGKNSPTTTAPKPGINPWYIAAGAGGLGLAGLGLAHMNRKKKEKEDQNGPQ